MPFTYIVEHMEEDDETPKALPEWVELEYKHMRTLAGPRARVHFSHLSQTAGNSLSTVLKEQPGQDSLAVAECHQIGVLDLMKQEGIPLDKVCLLDPKADEQLSPADGDGCFAWFLFGGILGDDPPRDRTSELRALGFPGRHLGSIQMTTDTALGVTKIVVDDKVPLQDIPYVDHPTITFNANESVEMPFRYIADDGGPRLPVGMRKLLHEDLNKSFDF